ncbi:MAG TPA: hypothetical protein VF017_22255 [Thermoanaerobaculia bacterium]|nr:hypothetical protein [Thermoanaerobaculia bacterium]
MAAPPTDWHRLSAPPGLCRSCRHARLLASARSVFLRCELSDEDPSFLRFPPLPVQECGGWEKQDEGEG